MQHRQLGETMESIKWLWQMYTCIASPNKWPKNCQNNYTGRSFTQYGKIETQKQTGNNYDNTGKNQDRPRIYNTTNLTIDTKIYKRTIFLCTDLFQLM